MPLKSLPEANRGVLRVESKLSGNMRATTGSARGRNMRHGESNGVFVLKILQYGFETTDIKLRRKRPFIVLAAELLNRQGKCLWNQQIINMDSPSAVPEATWEEYEAHPEKLRADWNKQIETVLAQLFPAKK
ncbi:MAG TPA: hypothetical protein VNT26_23175 [Candidatus Sulfotelmatobacter sp.]|nr:hypothetical protein [Candidatus Sulfotelmatobacter sp.]